MLNNYYVPGKEGLELKTESLLSKIITQLSLLLLKRWRLIRGEFKMAAQWAKKRRNPP